MNDKKSSKEYSLILSALMTQAIDHILRTSEIKQRGKAKIHAGLMKKIRKKCMKMTNDFQGSFGGGSFVVTSKEVTFLEDEIKRLYEGRTGVPGSISEGTVDLEEFLDDIKLQIFAEKKNKKEKD